jgi:cation diffusion facilitator CzcD-associated flavoprotein CzcO
MATQIPSYDILLIGAGFSEITLLHTLRQYGYTSCRIYESASDLGGVWHSNTYPGYRIDTEGSIYQLSILEVYSTFSFSEKYPSADEVREYFAHVERVLDIKKDVEFGVTATGAWFDVSAEGERKWRVETADGRVTHCRFLISCVGSSAQRYVPDIPGLDSFRAQVCHSADWPKGGVDVVGKKVAVIGRADYPVLGKGSKEPRCLPANTESRATDAAGVFLA